MMKTFKTSEGWDGCARCHQYRFNHGFSALSAHGDVVHLVLLAEVAHHLVGGIKHFTEVGEEPKAPAAKWQEGI